MSTLRISRQQKETIIKADYPNPIMGVTGEENKGEERQSGKSKSAKKY